MLKITCYIFLKKEKEKKITCYFQMRMLEFKFKFSFGQELKMEKTFRTTFICEKLTLSQ